jgi:hypothetical protein
MLAAGLLASIPAFGQVTIQQKGSAVSGVDFQAMNDGRFGLNLRTLISGFTVPRGSNQTYMFGGGVWFGARKMNGGEMKKLTFVTYNPNSGVSWATPGEGYLAPSPDGDHPALANLFRSVDFDRQTGAYTGKAVAPDTAASWPLWLLPSEHASAMRPGRFAPYNAQRAVGPDGFSAPAFVLGADEEFVARFHDNDLERYEGSPVPGEGFPIGLQVEQNIYGWAGGTLKNAVVLSYMFINTSPDTLRDCVIGYMWDPDVGRPDNDAGAFYASRPELRSAYNYNWSVAGTEVGYGAFVTTLIAAPMVDASGFIDNGAREGFRLQGRVGAFRSWMIEEDPSTSEQRYDFMSPGRIDADTGPGDKRGLLATRKFSMRPGDTAYFAVGQGVIAAAPGESAGRDELERIAEEEMTFYYSPEGIVGVPRARDRADVALSLLPNPARDRATVGFRLRAPGRVAIRLVNVMGEVVAAWSEDEPGAGEHRRELGLTGVAPGAYIVTVRTEEGESAARLMVVR